MSYDMSYDNVCESGSRFSMMFAHCTVIAVSHGDRCSCGSV